MGKLRTATLLQPALDDEIGWRIGELSNLKAAINNSESLRRQVLLRAAVPIAYAHWEGFIKRAATHFADFLSSQGLTYSQLRPCFSGVGVISTIHALGGIKRKIATASVMVSEIQAFGFKPVSIRLWPVIEEVGNLNYEMFEEIAEFLGISTLPYSTKKNFIDETLIGSRNRIAHGERLEVDQESINSIFSEVNLLMRAFKTDVENNVSLKSYLI